MTAAFGDEHPDQPVGTNNKRIIMMLAAGGIAVGAGLTAKAYFASHADQKPVETGVSIYNTPPADSRKFKTGYQIDEKKPDPPVAPVVEFRPAPLAPPPAPVAAPPKPPPVKSGFIGEWSSKGAMPGGAMAARGGAAGGTGSGGGGAFSAGEYRPGMNDGRDSLGEDAVQGQSAWKNRWMASAGTQGQDYVTNPWMPAIAPTLIQAGTIVTATTLTAINSDLPGDVVAMINSPVCDTSTGQWLLLPPNTKLYGRYSDQLAPFQERAQVAWTRILFQNGSSQNIGSMPGVDATGASGAKGDVDTHPWGMAGAVGLAGLLSIIGQTGQILSATQGGNDGATAIGVVGGGASGAGHATQAIGNKIISRQLDRSNTLTIDPGSTISLMFNKDLALPAYEGRSCGE